MSKSGKRVINNAKTVGRETLYTLPDALKLVKAAANTKFDETIEIAMNLNVDPRQADQNIRGMINLPKGTGKTVRVAVFAKGDNVDLAKKAGADIVGAEDLVDMIKKGDINFDRLIATPDMMGLVGQVGRILGPKGLMPNPKLGTVTTDVEKAVKDNKGGAVEYRVEKTGIVHVGVGKASFSEKDLAENINALINVINRAKPQSVKGTFIKRTSLSSSMGPGVKLDIAGTLAALSS